VRNHKAGIRWEIGAHVSTHKAETEIYGNRCFGNGKLAPSDSGGIRVNSANTAYIHHNIVGPNDGGKGISCGGERHPVYDVRVEDNRTVGGDTIAGVPSGSGCTNLRNGPNTEVDESKMFSPA
jgi:hypothetical protein